MATGILIIGCNGFVSGIETQTGTEIWRTKLKEGVLGSSRGHDVSVLYDADKIFAGCYGRVYALDPSDGKIIWSNNMEGIGFNEVALAMQGTNTQFITRVVNNG